MVEGEVQKYCFLTKETLEEARKPFYAEGTVAENINDSLLLILDLSDVNPRRREKDKVLLSYAIDSTAIDLGYRGDQIEVPDEVDSNGVEDEIIDMLDQIVTVEAAEIYGGNRINQLIKAAETKHQDEIQDIVIVTPEDHTHEIEGELVKQKLDDEIEVMTPEEIHEEFYQDEQCNIE
ncbi:MAG: hypothetical protein ABEJ98_04440 [Candidatus Nanohaloarchaea archaeon]